MSDNQNIIITKETVQRLLSDVKDLIKNPLTDENIYYIHDDLDMLKGYALIIGPDDCIYEQGAYFFEFNFPSDYPLQPPTVVYHTNDGKTRFNPNLYRNGKVCVSILNTWKGEQWTSCQTIRSVLMTLVTLFVDNPLLNEPGFTESNKSCKPYRNIIEYMNYKTAIHAMITQRLINNNFLGFYPIIKAHATKKKDEICSRLTNLVKSDKNGKEQYVSVYNMNLKLDYDTVLNEMNVALAAI